MASVVLCPATGQTVMRNGRPVVGAKIYFYNAGTTTPRTVYVDANLQAAHPHPVLTDGQGMVPPIYIGSGSYKYRVLTPNNVIIYEVDGLPGAVGSTDTPDPGENYPLTDSTAVLITGDMIASYRTGSRAGFARCNGNTIGTAASGASEIAVGVPSNQLQPIGSAYPLFIHLWENASNLPVYSAGVEVARGATANADWNANRQLGLPDARGRALMGLDGMGGPDANRLQFARELTTTKGSNEAYVTSVDGIVIGMGIIGTGIPVGAVVNAIDDLKLTLSLPASSTSSPSARFSQFEDARVLGASGGAAFYRLGVGQLPAHNHTATSSSENAGDHSHSGWTDVQGNHAHSYADSIIAPGAGAQGGSGVGSIDRYLSTAAAGNHSHNVGTHAAGLHAHVVTTTLADTGRGQSYSAVQSSLLITWYIKL